MVQPPYGPGPRHPQRPLWDPVLTASLTAVLLLVMAAALLYSLLAGTATAACSQANPCDYGLIDTGYAVAWGGAAVAVLVTLIGVIVAAVRRRLLVIWPVAGWVVFLASYLTGAVMVISGLPD
ncbi:hypothetical protein ABQE69_07595 [Mycolicibacillus trivialis]